MTNTGQMTIDQMRGQEGIRTMQGYIETTQVVIRARINEREAEAAGERLAAAARATRRPSSLRRSVGVLLIHAGQRVAGGQASSGPSAARPAHRMAT